MTLPEQTPSARLRSQERRIADVILAMAADRVPGLQGLACRPTRRSMARGIHRIRPGDSWGDRGRPRRAPAHIRYGIDPMRLHLWLSESLPIKSVSIISPTTLRFVTIPRWTVSKLVSVHEAKHPLLWIVSQFASRRGIKVLNRNVFELDVSQVPASVRSKLHKIRLAL